MEVDHPAENYAWRRIEPGDDQEPPVYPMTRDDELEAWRNSMSVAEQLRLRGLEGGKMKPIHNALNLGGVTNPSGGVDHSGVKTPSMNLPPVPPMGTGTPSTLYSRELHTADNGISVSEPHVEAAKVGVDAAKNTETGRALDKNISSLTKMSPLGIMSKGTDALNTSDLGKTAGSLGGGLLGGAAGGALGGAALGPVGMIGGGLLGGALGSGAGGKAVEAVSESSSDSTGASAISAGQDATKSFSDDIVQFPHSSAGEVIDKWLDTQKSETQLISECADKFVKKTFGEAVKNTGAAVEDDPKTKNAVLVKGCHN
jgi:hypothetical protein